MINRSTLLSPPSPHTYTTLKFVVNFNYETDSDPYDQNALNENWHKLNKFKSPWFRFYWIIFFFLSSFILLPKEPSSSDFASLYQRHQNTVL